MIADIFITHKPIGDGHGRRDGERFEIFKKSMESFFKTVNRKENRIHLIVDGSNVVSFNYWDTNIDYLDFDTKIVHKENQGLGPCINQAIAYIYSINEWYDHPTHGDKTKVAPFICYVQDDLLYTDGWLEKLVKTFLLLENEKKLGFASGVECVEHQIQEDLGNGRLLKPWIRAANIVGRREYWTSMMPIPRLDPETGQIRARPNDGIGSGVDWWLIRNHANSIVKSGKTCLVMPGLITHARI